MNTKQQDMTKKILNTSITTIRKRVGKLAYDLIHNQYFTQSEAMKWAWFIVRRYPQARTVTFAKSDGSMATRLVDNWSKYNQPKGTGKPLPAHLILMQDMDKHHSGINATISIKKANIFQII